MVRTLRTPNNRNQVEISSCPKCSEPDTSFMVQCDNGECNKWFHFNCVNVNEDIANHPWSCENCSLIPPNNDTLSSKQQSSDQHSKTSHNENKSTKTASSSHKSNRNSRRLALARLEEERAMQSRRDNEYLNKKYEVLALYSASEDDSDIESIISTRRTHEWVVQNDKIKKTTGQSNCNLINSITQHDLNNRGSSLQNFPNSTSLAQPGSNSNIRNRESSLQNYPNLTSLVQHDSNERNRRPSLQDIPNSTSSAQHGWNYCDSLAQNNQGANSTAQQDYHGSLVHNKTSLPQHYSNGRALLTQYDINSNAPTQPHLFNIPSSQHGVNDYSSTAQLATNSPSQVINVTKHNLKDDQHAISMPTIQQYATNSILSTQHGVGQPNSIRQDMHLKHYDNGPISSIQQPINQYMANQNNLCDSTSIQQPLVGSKFNTLQYTLSSHGPLQTNYTALDTFNLNNTSRTNPKHTQFFDTSSQPRNNKNESSGNDYPNDNQPTSSFLNTSHMAARHALSRDLPSFSGKYEEWPLFISFYENTTRTCNLSNDENLVRLQKSLKGKALEAVRCRLLLPSNVPHIISTLRMLFGRPEQIITILLQKIRKERPPRADKLETLIQFSLLVQNLCATMEASGMKNYLCNPTLIQEITDKLPESIKLSWAIYKQSLPNVSLSSLNAWLTELSYAASDVTVFTDFGYQSEISSKNDYRSNKVTPINSHVDEIPNNRTSLDSPQLMKTTSKSENSCLICKEKCLSIPECSTFRKLTHKQRWAAVHENKLCRKCLSCHKSYGCKVFNNVCGKNNCVYKHHKLLHNDNNDNKKHETQNNLKTNDKLCAIHQMSKSSILFPIIPVVLSSKKAIVETFAFLDDGSSITLIETKLADKLEINGISDPLCLKWTGDTRRMEENSHRVALEISAVGNSNKFEINAHTVELLDLPIQSLFTTEIKKKYHHLKDIPLVEYENAVPQILIGLDNLKLHIPMKIKEGRPDQPIGARTRLGWTVYGPCKNEPVGESYVKDEKFSCHICECDPDTELNRMVKNFYTIDNSGVTKTKAESTDDARSRSILEETIKKNGNRYEVGLLWKYDNFILPDSLPMAKKRLECLVKKLSKDPDLAISLNEQIKQYLMKGYARKLTKNEMKGDEKHVWYLPTFPVVNPNKPGKIRIVWDAAAQSDGVSLNKMLLKGPDELASLFEVLLRFRERRIALCGDISEMFHQVNIRKEDQNCQRFLWPASEGGYDVYIMQVMTFGASCSPSSAQHVMRKNATEFSNKYPRAVVAIMKNHYVDDLLDSCDTEEEAVELAKNVHTIHQQAGFTIRNFISNSKNVIETLDQNNLDAKMSLCISDKSDTEKVLGMYWNTSEDCFTYSLKINKFNKDYLTYARRPTKREVLRSIMSIFDPLGLISFYIVYVKILMQSIWRSAIGWDDPILDPEFERWERWVKFLKEVQQIRIPRCYLKDMLSYENTIVELHTFADASEDAYAAVSYLRVKNNDKIHCSIVAAKTRVSPLKQISIPRLELEAAVLATRLASSVVNALSITISRQYYWTDSRVVKCWLSSDSKKYRQFVSFRIGEILETTSIHDWNWLPSKMNVADIATKWQVNPDFQPTSKWFLGPDFLYQDNIELLSETEIEVTTEELRPQYVYHVDVQNTGSLVDIEKFSSWKSLLNCIAWCYRFIGNMKAKRQGNKLNTGPLTQEEYIKSENALYRQSQAKSYPDEVAILHKNSSVLEKSSTLFKCCPHLDSNGVIRTSGRVNLSARIGEYTKNPIILSGKCSLTQLIISHYHHRYHHHNHETVVNEIRQKYDISRLRVILKKIRKSCQACHIENVQPQIPRMADLPECRLAAYTRPFTFIGIDYFGPMTVCIGRKTEKRWGMLITCLTVRAIHIEVVDSLSTDSCIIGLRNFISRRGTPNEIYSDCGTNFRGADKELQTAMQNVNNQKMMTAFESTTTKWNFNPPGAPHMGGSWERLVRSVKTTLNKIMPRRNPTDELLRSMLIEVENIVNSRPLTYIPLDTENEEALTPNHFILGSSNGTKPIGLFSNYEVLLKKNYLKSQQFACHYWRRWVKEYLPILTKRTKWLDLKKPIRVGDIVIVVDEKLPRNTWPKGRIIQTYPSSDGQVRKVRVQTKFGIFERPASRIAVLNVSNNSKSPPDGVDVLGGNVTNASPTYEDSDA